MESIEEEPPKSGTSLLKTPVSLLQELYVRKGITPTYDLLQSDGAVHEPVFKFRVTVGDLMAVGSGQSKKKAKHAAAKAMIDQLKSLSHNRSKFGDKANFPLAVTKLDSQQSTFEVIDMITPYDDGIEGNPVGELQELCTNRRLQPPIYAVSLEDGAPHERRYIMQCSVGIHSCSGVAKSKKLAKRQAAHQMISTLKSMPVDNEECFMSIDEDDLAQSIVSAAANPALINPYCKLKKYHRNLKPSRGVHLANLHNEEIYQEKLENDPMGALQEIATEQEMKLQIDIVDEMSADGKFHCFAFIDSDPRSVLFADGDTQEMSEKKCARNALEYLKLMSGP